MQETESVSAATTATTITELIQLQLLPVELFENYILKQYLSNKSHVFLM